MNLMQPYDEALTEVLNSGVKRKNRRTQDTLSIFGLTKRYRLDTEYFPILTRRKINPKAVFAELLWFLEGNTSNDRLIELGCKYWTPWVDKEFEDKNIFMDGVFGPVYGFNLRYFDGDYNYGVHDGIFYGRSGFDQLKYIIDEINNDPTSRRILWNLWNPKELTRMRLPPCHVMFQILIDDDRRMTGILYQRSGDLPLGVWANVQFYSAIIHMICQQTDCTPLEFVHMIGDAHCYFDQLEQVKQYLELPLTDSPKLKINKAKDIYSYRMEDFVISDYNSGPKINFAVSV